MNTAQILALIIFIAMFLMIIMDKIERHIVALVCAALTIVLVFGIAMQSGDAIMETLNVKSLFTLSFWYPGVGTSESSSAGINWETIIFIAGMMIVVEGMGRVGFFKWLCIKLASAVHYKPMPLLIVFMLLSAVLSMFIDSITVILFLATATVELSKITKTDPIPMILAEIFCSNLGGSATMCGDPPNIILGTALGYTFADFVTNTGFMALVALIIVMIYYYFIFRKQLTETHVELDESTLPSARSFIKNKRHFILCILVFLYVIIMLCTHAQTGFSVATIGVSAAILTMLVDLKEVPSIIKSLDYKTLLFFIGLFVVVDGLSQTGILDMIASFINSASSGSLVIMVAIILWVSAIASAFIDNIPFAATMIPVIKSLASSNGVPLTTLAWALSMGTDIGGSATPIGASANVVGLSVAAKAGHPVGWGRYCKTNAPATIIVVAVSMVILFVRYC